MIFGGSVLAVLATITTILSGFGTRSDWWDFRIGFMVLKWGAYSAAVAGILCFFGGLWASVSGRYRSAFIAATGLLLSMITMGIPWSWKHTISQVPPIHDISTDMVVPPEFVKILPLRNNAPNSATYGGPEIAAQQREAYPELTSLVLERPTDHAFTQILDVIDYIGWELVDASSTEGRIEAIDTTFWFGFKDDVVIRVLPSKTGSKIDIRSVSRVGRSDVGSNAKRIQAFLDALNAKQ
tara:strand:+ start:2490 stop:3206 length:717 start_codon:yes stop_codon:yes gene_type:complete